MGKMVNKITSMDEDFARWYTDIVKNAELIDYSNVRGCNILRPYGFAVWENITSVLDKSFKKIGVENVSMPLLIPESLLQKEKSHIKGFAPEVAWVTMGGDEILNERLCIRPTSEVLFCSHFSKIVNSWRDLPKLYNQWCSIVRWEKTSRPFLRSVEIHWQEGHTIHETKNEARQFTLKILNLYAEFFENVLCIPVILGKKTEREKFAGAQETYTIECIMKDGKALQSATSHYFGNNFSSVFDIKFKNRKNEYEFAYQTSWGLSTRVIAAIIMTHADNDGLIFPPDIAPIQIVIIPISIKTPGVKDEANKIYKELKENFRVKIDMSDQTPGWKFAEYEMKGVPVRLEIGPREISKNSCILVRRDTRGKQVVQTANIKEKIEKLLGNIKKDLYSAALSRRDSKIFSAANINEFSKISKTKEGFIKTTWCNDLNCEEKIKNDFGLSSRCMPFDESIPDGAICPICGKIASKIIFWGRSY